MAEKSYFHNGTARGDAGDAPIGDTLFHTIMQSMYNADGIIYTEGYVDLISSVSGSDRDVDVLSGSAFVQGVYFDSNATETFTLDTAKVNRYRFDRIVIRVNWATQMARLAVVKGEEGVVPTIPALQQDFGLIWEFPLSRVWISGNAAVIQQYNVFDERIYLSSANTPPIKNIMHNSEFIANANTSFDREAPAYWWTTGGYTVENSGIGLDLQSRGRAIQAADMSSLDLLETALYACNLSTTYWPDKTVITVAFYIHVLSGSVGISFDGGAGVDYYLATPTDEPQLILFRWKMGSTFNTLDFYFKSYGTSTTFNLYQVTAAFGPNPAPFLPNKETILFGTKVAATGSPFTRSTGSYTLDRSLLPLATSLPSESGVYFMQRVWDTGSSGANIIYASVGDTNNIRTEVGRLPNSARRQHIGFTQAGDTSSSPYTIPIAVVASGAGALTQEIYAIGCEV